MKDLNFENAFSPVPTIVHTRIMDTLKEVKTVKKAKPIAALVLAAVLLMALAGVAFATVQSGVLDFIFHSGERTQEQMDLVQPLGLMHKENGVMTTVTDAMLDGNMLSVALDFDAEKEFYIITDSVTINGVELAISDSNIVNMWYGDYYSAQHSFSTRGFKGYLDAEAASTEAEEALFDEAMRQMTADGVANVKLHLTYLIPKQELVPIENVIATDSRKAWEAIDACVAAGNTPIEEESGYVLVDRTWVKSYHDSIPAFQLPIGDAEAHIEHSNMELLDSFEFSFQMKVGQSEKTDITPKPISDGRMLITFKEISLSPTETLFDFTIAPEPGFMTIEEVENRFPFFSFYGCYEMDTAPVLLDFQDTTYEGECFKEEQTDGSMALHVKYRMPALSSPPLQFILVPYNTKTGPDEPAWDYAIYI